MHRLIIIMIFVTLVGCSHPIKAYNPQIEKPPMTIEEKAPDIIEEPIPNERKKVFVYREEMQKHGVVYPNPVNPYSLDWGY